MGGSVAELHGISTLKKKTLKKKTTQAKHDQTSSPPRATDPTWTTGVDNVWLMGPSVENVSKRWTGEGAK